MFDRCTRTASPSKVLKHFLFLISNIFCIAGNKIFEIARVFYNTIITILTLYRFFLVQSVI